MRRAVAKRLALEHAVVIVSDPASVMREPMAALRFSGSHDRPVPGSIVEVRPLHFPVRLPIVGGVLNRFNQMMLARKFATLFKGAHTDQHVIFYDSPSQHPLVGTFGETLSVYLAIDDRTLTVSGEPIEGELGAERRLLSAVDRVICVSHPLADALRARVPDRPSLPIDIVSNGYDEQLFRPDLTQQEPLALASMARPRILVSGHVSDRIDWEGIAAFSAVNPRISWAFLGPTDAGIELRVREIASISGADVRILPPVSHAEVPAFVAHVDVCAAPYRLNAFTRSSSPLKVVEYLGAGAPVVSTRVAALEPFREVIHFVEEANGDSYQAAIIDALSDSRSPEFTRARVASVAEHTWAMKAEEIYRIICAGSEVREL